MKSKEERLKAAGEKYLTVVNPVWVEYVLGKKKPALKKYKAIEKVAREKYLAECDRIEKEEKEEIDSQLRQKVMAGLRKVISQTNVKQAREVAWDLLKESEAGK